MYKQVKFPMIKIGNQEDTGTFNLKIKKAQRSVYKTNYL